MPKIAGIDYSMTSPSICVYEGNLVDFHHKGCRWFFLTSKKNLGDGQFMEGRIESSFFPEWNNSIQRFKNIASWAVERVRDCSLVMIEDYSMGSKGKVFHIAENCGILKHELYVNEIPFATVPPTVLKKFATGKGNSSKEEMYDSFQTETKVNVIDHINPKLKESDNPISDIVDSFFLAKYCAIGYQSI
jgi:Holliday junction resolvasome RuvABC endonuclease subunit